ncbi:hypothetical protein H4S04_006152 [Coemansia sp. S16]|nr:hypothetical protein GGI14_004660 [Coemansia sp. S680]KAJ2031334.1 hypothetical protein H4S03_006670 [Coemansia sp. S3946]KAJ2044540.1 hypothetical protein H4S04_006152 [Coemansia sp. S16]
MAETTPRNSSSVTRDMQNLKVSTEEVGRAEDVQVDSDQSKFSAMLSILRKLVGVADVISLRLSLPAQLLDPIPNLEYWNYMDRPDFFVAIPESDDEVERMLATLAWWFSKLLKHTGKVLKPFNSVLGEQFFCHWEVPREGDIISNGLQGTATSSATDVSAANATNNGALRVEYITEQVSHHPPVSAHIYRCQERGIEAAGIDHISAKFTGLSATVAAGSHCKGIFVTLTKRDNETYVCTHPTANIVGWLRGSLKVQCVETSYIVCAKTKLATIVEFKEERWFGKNKDNVSGRVFRYDPETQAELIPTWRLKDIPKSCPTVATFSGNWDKLVSAQREDNPSGSANATRTLIDMSSLQVVDKIVKPLEEQGEMESRRVWDPVASKMLQGKFSDATKLKRIVEDAQRERTAARNDRGEEFVPALFKPDYSNGRPELLETAPINL